MNRRVAVILLAGACALVAFLVLRMGDSLGGGEPIGPDPGGASAEAGSDASVDFHPPAPLPGAAAGGARTESFKDPVAPLAEVKETIPTRLVARVVDPQGAAIPHARALLRAGGKTDALPVSKRGTVEATLTDIEVDAALAVRLSVEAEGYASRVVEASAQYGRECSLGSVILQVEAALVGVVRDDSGLPLLGAEVYVEYVPEGLDVSTEFPAPDDVNRQLGSHLAHTVGKDTPRAITDAKGAYAFHGLGEGTVRLWATLPGKLAAYSEVLGAHSGFRTAVPDLVLGLIEPERIIRGRVLRPDGKPAYGARVTLVETAWYRWTGAYSAKDGTFELPLIAGEIYDLIGDDPQGRWGAAEVPGVQAGSSGIVFRLRECEPSSIAVTDEEGMPIPYYGFSVSAVDGTGRPRRFDAERRSGDVRCPILPTAFHMTVVAPGYGSQTIGPLEPMALPPLIEFQLKRDANVYGVVTFGGEPVPGATVEARALVGEAEGFSLALGCRQPFMLPMQAKSLAASTVTDASGHFYLDLAEGEVYAVRAQGKRRGPSVETQVEGGAGKVELELQPMGAVLGKVVDRAGVAQAGCTVAATAGFGNLVFAQADSQGEFLFDQLGPGRHWLAVLARGQPNGGASRGASGNSSRTPIRDGYPAQDEQLIVEVMPGAVGEVLITVEEKKSVAVSGQLTVVPAGGGSMSVEGWGVTATSLSDPQATPQRTIVGEGGTFALMIDSGSTHRLTIEGVVDGRAIHVSSELRPAGRAVHWDRSLFLATLGGTVGRKVALNPLRELGALVKVDGGIQAYVAIERQAGGVIAPLALPGGRVSVVELRMGTEVPAERVVRVWKEFSLAPGGALEVVVD